MKFYDRFIGDGKFCWTQDDQAAVLAPERTWSMREIGIILEVAHNGQLGEHKKLSCGGFRNCGLDIFMSGNFLIGQNCLMFVTN